MKKRLLAVVGVLALGLTSCQTPSSSSSGSTPSHPTTPVSPTESSSPVSSSEDETLTITIVAPEKTVLKVDESMRLSFEVDKETDKEPLWASSNPDVLSVDSTGTIVAKSVGTASVTVEIDGFKSLPVEFTIIAKYDEASSVSYTSAVALTPNEELEIKPAILPVTASPEFTLESADEDIVSVSGSSIVAKKLSSDPVVVTIKAGNAQASFNVYVLAKNYRNIFNAKHKLLDAKALEKTKAKSGTYVLKKDDKVSAKYSFEVFSDSRSSVVEEKSYATERTTYTLDGGFLIKSTEQKGEDGKFSKPSDSYDYDIYKVSDDFSIDNSVTGEEAEDSVSLPILGNDAVGQTGFSQYALESYFGDGKFLTDETALASLTSDFKDNVFTFSVSYLPYSDEKHETTMSLTFDSEGLLTGFAEESKLYYDYGDGLELEETDVVEASLSTGEREKSPSEFIDYSGMYLESFDAKFVVKNEERTRFMVGETASIQFENENPSTFDSIFDKYSIEVSDKTVATVNANKRTIRFNKEAENLTVKISSLKVTKTYTLKVLPVALESLVYSGAKYGFVGKDIQGKVDITPSKASVDLDVKITSSNASKATVDIPDSTKGVFTINASEEGEYEVTITDKKASKSIAQVIKIYSDSDASLLNLLTGNELVVPYTDTISDLKITKSSDNKGTISYHYDGTSEGDSLTILDFNQSFTIENKVFKLDSSSTSNAITAITYDDSLEFHVVGNDGKGGEIAFYFQLA